MNKHGQQVLEVMEKVSAELRSHGPSRLDILNEIGYLLSLGMQDFGRDIHSRTGVDRFHEAKAFIHFLEIFDCGICGGFDEGQTRNCTLFDRYEWLVCKYNKPEDLEPLKVFKTFKQMRWFFARH